jgi:hypothetical protein
MTTEEARKIGGKQALKSVGIGLIIAQLMMTLLSSDNGFLKGLIWFTDISFGLNLAIGIIIMLLCGYYFGQKAGFEILIKERNYAWIGLKYGMLILLTTAFLSGWTGFFQDGLNKNNYPFNNSPFHDYIIKPTLLIFEFGFFPVLFVGFWFGKQIKNKALN